MLASEEIGSVPWYNHLRRMLEHLHEAAEVDHPSALAWLGELALVRRRCAQPGRHVPLYQAKLGNVPCRAFEVWANSSGTTSSKT